MDASANWWGSSDPTTVAGMVSDDVDFTPLLDSGTDTDPATPGFQPSLSSLTVHTLGSQSGSTGRIQEGVNLVSGSTVNVAAGTYDEQVVINKSLTLQGAGDTTIIKPSSAAKLTQVYDGLFWYGTPNTKQIAGIIVANVSDGSAVTVKNLKVDESLVTTNQRQEITLLVSSTARLVAL